MRERPDGRMEITATLPESLADRVESALDNNPELTDARLVREGLRDIIEDQDDS